MTIQGLYLLHQIKSVRHSLEDEIYIDFDDDKIQVYSSSTEAPSGKTFTSRFWMKHFQQTIGDLCSTGYLVECRGFIDGASDYQITPQGQYNFQYFFGHLISFLLKSVLVPIAVSVITSWLLIA